ncbi:MAG: hypothetical protein KatS3mg087_1376 [Patescibacteria group bacterium]|nr:MAG: hypothetical protein KatS3mg087_1376 [Patescibacteria group bacterium]
MADELDELAEKINKIGPRRVKGKEVDIEAHNPAMVQRLIERLESKPVHFSDFKGTVVSAKNPWPKCDEEDSDIVE